MFRMTGGLSAVLLLSACGRSDPEPGPGDVTLGEARALDAAAEMFDARPQPTVSASTASTPTAADEAALRAE